MEHQLRAPRYRSDGALTDAWRTWYVDKNAKCHARLKRDFAIKTGSGLTDFKRQLERLDRNLFSIIAWDPPGYGASRPPQRYFGDDMFIRDADNAVQFMRVSR